MRRRSRFSNKLKIAVLFAVVFVGSFAGVFAYQNLAKDNSTQALSATEFQAGRIIDDSIFYNPNTMTAAEIDTFIDSHSPACDMWGEGYSYGMKNKDYARMMRNNGNSRWHDPPYVCISEFYENPETHKTNFETNGKREAGMLSAGEIIYKAAQTYNINPQVLLVMLKKESYAWGDDWPLKWEYNTVMGYACPDGAPCNEEYFGFYNQMMTAAWQLNYYREHIYSYNYRPYATNNILYNPDRSCGSKSVYLENLATTSLYIYTPYTPNDGALQNYPGTSWCGSYGNRNFYMYFREWFGDTLGKSGEYEINERYRKLGGEESELGKPITDSPNCNIGRSGACVQAYENGVIIYSHSTGAWENYSPIRDKYIETGSVVGVLGYPISSINCNIGYKDACVQAYENGTIISNPKTGTWETSGIIREEFLRQGSISGPLGFPINSESCISSECTQEYENGTIETKNGLAIASFGEILNKYSTLKEKLGPKISTTNCNIGHKDACVQAYENGVIISSPNTGTWENSGEIRARYLNNGSVDGFFGFPLSDIICKDSACYQAFENRAILQDQNNQYWVSSKNIAEYYLKIAHTLGGATTNINCNIDARGTCVQGFEKGVIISNPATGTWENYGEIRKKYVAIGSNTSYLGLPTSGIECEKNTCTQKYEKGTLSNN